MNIETANRLFELRKKNNFSQEQLAEKIGVSRQAVSKWERGEASPDIDNLILLSKLYNMSLDQLINNKILPPEEVLIPKDDFLNDNSSLTDNVSQSDDYEIKAALSEISQTVEEVATLEESINKVITATNKSKKKKIVFRVSNIPYPLIITIIYLFLGFAFNWWHPAWILYLTIPIYYCCFEEVDIDDEG